MSGQYSGAGAGLEKKRKEPPTSINTPHRPRNAKRVKIDDARTILKQTSEEALNQNGELDVSAFVQAREFEIRAMESSMGASKRALSSRAFQQVPNELRRRVASHNVKRVPKRLRSRAMREMKEDNTPTVTSRRRKPTPHMRLRLETAKKLQKLHVRRKKKSAETKEQKAETGDSEGTGASAPPVRRQKKNTLAKPDKQGSKFRERQKHKCWLPTHVYHAKRAHMTEPKHPLWRFAIALSPTEKTYRKTHRAGSLRGCMIWDTSYMSIVQIEGVEASLAGLLRGIGVDEDALTGTSAAKWRKGTRSWHGSVRERDNKQRWITNVDIIWCVQQETPDGDPPVSSSKKLKRRCFLRIHPSAFLQLWSELLKVAKLQHPPATVEDLRFEIGSLELTGPGSTEALVAALMPTDHTEGSAGEVSAQVWPSLGSITNPACLPANAILDFSISDPRLHYPPRAIKQPTSDSASDELLQILASWPPDTTTKPPSIFNRTSRFTASRQLPSQKAINRRKSDAMPGDYPAPAPTDPQIPVLLMATHPPTGSGQGSWTLLLPWKCVLPVWYYIMHYPLSTGGNPRFGGLEGTRQIAFEQGIPWFPGDYPGTQAGWEWELAERAKRKAEWGKRPKGKRVAWESLDLGLGRKGEIGLGWACDWEYLFNPAPAADAPTAPQATDTDLPANSWRPPKSNEGAPTTADASTATTVSPLPAIHQVPVPLSSSFLTSSMPLHPTASRPLATIHLNILSRGHPITCARIYRIPTTSPHSRAQWLVLADSILNPSKKGGKPQNTFVSTSHHSNKVLAALGKNESHPSRTEQTALSLLRQSPSHLQDTNSMVQPGHPSYPSVPDKEDLIGFVTTGNFDLGQGKASAIGCVAMEKIPRLQQSVPATSDLGVSGEEEEDQGWREVRDLEKKLGRKVVERLCIVRDAGVAVGRLAKWKLI
ncbi:MAG: hypothetical protein Q9219_002125 [cf. Caloplaca sp. 3 TL-2023]